MISQDNDKCETRKQFQLEALKKERDDFHMQRDGLLSDRDAAVERAEKAEAALCEEMDCRAKLQAELADLRWFCERVTKGVIPGETDSQDSGFIAIRDLRRRAEKAEVLVGKMREALLLTKKFIGDPEQRNNLSKALALTFKIEEALECDPQRIAFTVVEAQKICVDLQTALASPEPVPGRCGLCGGHMPRGEEMFKYHGYSGPCPKKDDSK